MVKQNNRNLMPFTRHCSKELLGVIKWLKETPLPAESLDAFLYEYVKSKDLDKAIFFACCEWDL